MYTTVVLENHKREENRYKCVTEQNFTIPKIVHILLLQVGNDDFAPCKKVQAESLIISWSQVRALLGALKAVSEEILKRFFFISLSRFHRRDGHGQIAPTAGFT